jgi:hypothetical protein
MNPCGPRDPVVVRQLSTQATMAYRGSQEDKNMAAEDVRLGGAARQRMLRGVNILADAVAVTLGPQG